jgi:hypothetical protein
MAAPAPSPAPASSSPAVTLPAKDGSPAQGGSTASPLLPTATPTSTAVVLPPGRTVEPPHDEVR